MVDTNKQLSSLEEQIKVFQRVLANGADDLSSQEELARHVHGFSDLEQSLGEIREAQERLENLQRAKEEINRQLAEAKVTRKEKAQHLQSQVLERMQDLQQKVSQLCSYHFVLNPEETEDKQKLSDLDQANSAKKEPEIQPDQAVEAVVIATETLEESKSESQGARPQHPAANLRVNRANLDLPCFSIAMRQSQQIGATLERFNRRVVMRPVEVSNPEARPQSPLRVDILLPPLAEEDVDETQHEASAFDDQPVMEAELYQPSNAENEVKWESGEDDDVEDDEDMNEELQMLLEEAGFEQEDIEQINEGRLRQHHLVKVIELLQNLSKKLVFEAFSERPSEQLENSIIVYSDESKKFMLAKPTSSEISQVDVLSSEMLACFKKEAFNLNQRSNLGSNMQTFKLIWI